MDPSCPGESEGEELEIIRPQDSSTDTSLISTDPSVPVAMKNLEASTPRSLLLSSLATAELYTL